MNSLAIILFLEIVLTCCTTSLHDSKIDGVVGGNVFKNFEIFADYQNSKLYFLLKK